MPSDDTQPGDHADPRQVIHGVSANVKQHGVAGIQACNRARRFERGLVALVP
jgi:hypothetical protein